jgi:hypothetical protein
MINQLDCPTQRLNAMKALIDTLIASYDQKLATYRGIFDKFEEIKKKRADIQNKLNQKSDEEKEKINRNTVNSITSLVNSFFTISYQDEN